MRSVLSTKSRPRVLDEVAGRVRYEHGSTTEFGRPGRAAVLVHWAPSPRLSRSVTTLVNELSSVGYRPVLVSACEAPDPLEWNGKRPEDAVVLRKPNIGYDFGSWAVALNELPAIAEADKVILVNDSMVGPFAPITDIVARFESSTADVFGLTDTRQYFRHLQSYFLGFNRGVLADKPLAAFFADVREEHDKWNIVRRYELGLSRMLQQEGYGIVAGFRADDVVQPGDNPVIRGWWRLLERGFPFVKREVLRNPDVVPRAEWVAREVRAVFGEQIEDWI
ncbi:MAG: rhamnan synthesis F family protein [Pseudonocardiales bacterium]